MDLTTEDAFGQSLAGLTPAPQVHTPTFGDDVSNFASDLTQPGFGQTGRTFRAAAKSAIENDLSFGVSDAWVTRGQYQPLIDAINKDRGALERVSNPYYAGLNPRDYLQAGLFSSREHFEDYIWQQADIERQRDPGRFANLPQSREHLLADVRAEQRTSLDYSRQLAATGGPVSGTAAQFAGGAAGGMADPVNILTSVSGFPAAESLLKTALVEGGANAAVEGITLPSRMAHYENIGEPMNGGDVAMDIGGAGVGGAALGVGGKLISRLLGLKGHALVDEFQAQNTDPTPTLRTAAAMVEDEANRAHDNPFADTAQGRDRHRQALMATELAIEEGRPDLLPDHSEELLPRLAANETEIAAAADDVAYARRAVKDEPGLFQEIRRLGGIAVRDERGAATREGGEIMAVLKDRRVPGLINNKGGMSPDYLREALRERGWFGGRDDQGADLQDLYDLMGQEAQGSKVYHPDSEVRAQRAARDGLDEKLGRAGVGARDSAPAAAEKLARWRLHSSDAEGSATRFWQRQADQAGVEYRATDLPEDLMASVFEAEAVRAERGGNLGQFADEAEARLRAHIERLYPDLKDAELEREFHDYAQREAVGGIEGQGGSAGPVGAREGGAGGLDPGAGSHPFGAPAREHFGRHDPEALKPFTDPIRKPQAFQRQADDLAREIAPAPQKPAAVEGEAAKPSPYGAAAPQIEALERLDGTETFADPVTGQISTIKDAAADAKRQARAVERLRGCIEGGT